MVFGAFLIAACSGEKEDAEPAAEVTQSKIQVATHRVAVEELQANIRAAGVVEAVEELTINVDFTSTVKRVLVDEGESVAAGQQLAELDPQKRRLALQRAQQTLNQTRAAVKEAQLDLDRRQRLAEQKTVSKEALDKAILGLDRASAQFKEAQAATTLAKRELADSRVLAPVAGVIDTRLVEVGETVMAGSPLFTVQAVGALRVQVWISDANINQVALGDKASVQVRGIPQPFAATVASLGINAHPNTGNFPVKLTLDDASNLRPGMTATATITGRAERHLVLPDTALTDRNRHKASFRIKDGKAELVQPQLRAGFGDRWLIVDGLAPGDMVAVSNLHSLYDGADVELATQIVNGTPAPETETSAADL